MKLPSKSKICFFIVAIFFITVGAFIVKGKFEETREVTGTITIIENSNNVSNFQHQWKSSIKSSLCNDGSLATTISIVPDPNDEIGRTSNFITGSYIDCLPDGLIISGFPLHDEILSIKCKIRFDSKHLKKVEGPWVQYTVDNVKFLDVKTDTPNLPKLENTFGKVAIVQFVYDNIESKLKETPASGVEIETTIVTPGYHKQSYRLLKGTITTIYDINVKEAKFLGINKHIWGDLKVPGQFLDIEEHPSRVSGIEYFWTSELQGGYIYPDGSSGIKMFYTDGKDRISGKVVYQVPGAEWISYVAEILGGYFLPTGKLH